MDLAQRLKSRRLAMGLSQKVLAANCGVSQPTVANWERGGHIPRQAALECLAHQLDVDPVWLLSGEQPAHLNPAHKHLSRKIQNIPVYDWPVSLRDLENAHAADYLTISLDGGEMLAILTQSGGAYPEGTVLLFDREDCNRSGYYLAEQDDKAVMTKLELAANDGNIQNEIKRNRAIARLVFTIQPH